jgi:hypothetical protein
VAVVGSTGAQNGAQNDDVIVWGKAGSRYGYSSRAREVLRLRIPGHSGHGGAEGARGHRRGGTGAGGGRARAPERSRAPERVSGRQRSRARIAASQQGLPRVLGVLSVGVLWVMRDRWVAGKVRIGPVGFLESRTAPRSGVWATSTQAAPPPPPLKVLFRQSTPWKFIHSPRTGHVSAIICLTNATEPEGLSADARRWSNATL